MASTVTATELTNRLRRVTDIEGATGRFPDAELHDYLKTSHRKWVDFILNHGGSHLFETTHSVSTAPPASTVSLASNHYRLVGVDAVAGGVTRTLRPLPVGERNRWNFDGVSWQGTGRIYYRVLGSVLRLYPTPDAAYSLTIHYIPEADVDFTTGSNTIDGFNGWDEFVVLEAAMLVLDKDNRKKDHVERRLADLRNSVVSSVRGLDVGEPDVVGDVTDMPDDFIYPSGRW